MSRRKAGRKQSLLVVEDDDEQRQTLTAMLEKLYPDLAVQSARDAAEAAERFDRTPFDVVLLDMKLGEGRDGVELLLDLRRKPSPFRAIGISAYSRSYAFRAGKSGLDEFLEKPVAPDKLMEAINQQLELARGQVRATKKAFCVMPFSLDLENLYLFGIKMAAERSGYLCYRSDEKFFTGDILTEVQRSIRGADLVIADISGNNPNVCYEVGFAHALKKPVILVTESVEGTLFDLRNLRHIIFDRNKLHKLQEDLEKALKELNAAE